MGPTCRTEVNPLLMSMAATKVPKSKFTKHSFERHKKLLSEMPERVAQRQQNMYNRNRMLQATQAYNLRLEKQRLHSHLSDFAALQKAMAQHHMGDLGRRIHKLTPSGLP